MNSNITNILNKVLSARGLILVIMSFFLAALAPFFAVSQAGAIGNCMGYKVCLYEYKEFGDPSLHIVPGSVPLCVNVGSFSSQVSSVVNNTPHTIRYFEFAGCNANVGCYFDDGAYSYRRNLANDRFTNNQHCRTLSPEGRIGSFFLFP